MKKVLWTLNVDNYAPEITALTFPLLERWAHKICAEFRVIDKRKWPDMPPVYEKLQIHELGRGNDWNIYLDADALVHPNMFDITDHLSKDTVFHNGTDMAGYRWRYDRYFRRDGRNIGSANWFAAASDWCIDLWEPLPQSDGYRAMYGHYAHALDQIFPTQGELATVIQREHLIDDYLLSRNIAKYALKVATMDTILARMNHKPGYGYLFHEYTIPISEKVSHLKQILMMWLVRAMTQAEAEEIYGKCAGLDLSGFGEKTALVQSEHIQAWQKKNGVA